MNLPSRRPRISIALAAITLFLVSVPFVAPAKNSALRPSSFFVVFPRYSYQRPLHELSQVDFKNITVLFFKPNGQCCVYSARLTNGRSFLRNTIEADDVALLGVNYFDFAAAEHPPTHAGVPKFAVATYGWVTAGGSVSGYGAVNLYTVTDNRLVLQEQINFVAETPGTGAFFDPTTRTVTVNASHYDNDDAHCCPSKIDIISFRWARRLFQKSSIRTVRYVKNSNTW